LKKYINNYVEKEKQRVKEIDVNNYNLGKYIAYAVNDPQHYPDKPFLVEPEMFEGEDMERIAKKNTILLGGKIKGALSSDKVE
jgi:hypothetical protein